MLKKNILLVSDSDEIINFESKMDVHKKGLLHRAFSILIFNDKDQMLLQKRAKNKYHSGGLWSNTCCGHPFIGKNISEYAQQRLFEELGINCILKFVFKFKYDASLDNEQIENEIVHVFIGKTNQNPILNTNEAEDFMWMNEEEIFMEIRNKPEKFTVWFCLIIRYLRENKISFSNLFSIE